MHVRISSPCFHSNGVWCYRYKGLLLANLLLFGKCFTGLRTCFFGMKFIFRNVGYCFPRWWRCQGRSRTLTTKTTMTMKSNGLNLSRYLEIPSSTHSNETWRTSRMYFAIHTWWMTANDFFFGGPASHVDRCNHNHKMKPSGPRLSCKLNNMPVSG